MNSFRWATFFFICSISGFVNSSSSSDRLFPELEAVFGLDTKSLAVAKSLFDAFRKAKDAYVARLKAGEGNAPDDVKYRNLTALVGDPLPYGLKENMPSIEAMLTYGLQQGLIPKRMPMEDVFVDPQRH